MARSDQEIGKKETELDELVPFMEARERATGTALELVASHENPDFLCARADGSLVGIELVKIMRDKDIARWERILDRKDAMEPYEMTEEIHWQLERKERARRDRYVKATAENILVLQLVDGELSGALRWMMEGLQGDFTAHGFEEVWLADYSGREAYGDIELFGLFPAVHWGHVERANPCRKPYG